MPKRSQPIGTNMKACQSDIGRFVRARRIALGLSQAELAKKIGITQTNLSCIEIGKTKNVQQPLLKKFAAAFEVPLVELEELIPKKQVAQPTTELGELVRSRREELGLTIQQLAEKMDCKPDQVKAFELRTVPTVQSYRFINACARALALDVSVFAKFIHEKQGNPTTALGKFVRTRRRALGMTARILAGKLGVTYQFVGSVERGESSLSSSDQLLKKFAKALRVELKVLESIRSKRKLKKDRPPGSLARFLTDTRMNLGLLQCEVAKKVGISTSLVSFIETGQYVPARKLLSKLAFALKVTIPPDLLPPPLPAGKVAAIRETVLSEWLIARRHEKGLTITQAATQASVSVSTMSGLERGTYRLSAKIAQRISEGFAHNIPAGLIP